jgi:dsRNA-specific ribonuclease
LACEELASCISLDALLQKFVPSSTKSSADVVPSSHSLNYQHFSKKVDCLLDILASSVVSIYPNEKTVNVTDSEVTTLDDVLMVEEDSKTSRMQNSTGPSTSSFKIPYPIQQVRSTQPLDISVIDSGSFQQEIQEGILHDGDVAAAVPSVLATPSVVTGTTIVFCTLRISAHSLNELLEDICKRWQSYCCQLRPKKIEGKLDNLLVESPFPLKSDFMKGSSSISYQKSVLKALKNGKINLLFATDVAQEGIDISQCNVIINYNGPKTLIGFIQRRGRARSKNSSLIHLVKSLNKKKDNETKDIYYFIQQEIETEFTLKSMYNELVPSSLDEDEEEEEEEEGEEGEIKDRRESDNSSNSSKNGRKKRKNCFIIPETGAFVDCISSKALLSQYCDYISLQIHSKIRYEYLIDFPRYFFERSYSNPSLWLCTLMLPDAIRKLYPDCPAKFYLETTKKRIAKGLISLKAIEFLYSKGEFDVNLRFRRFQFDHLSPLIPEGSSSSNSNRSHTKGVTSFNVDGVMIKALDPYITDPLNNNLVFEDIQVQILTKKVADIITTNPFSTLYYRYNTNGSNDRHSQGKRSLSDDGGVLLSSSLSNEDVMDTHYEYASELRCSKSKEPSNDSNQNEVTPNELNRKITNTEYLTTLFSNNDDKIVCSGDSISKFPSSNPEVPSPLFSSLPHSLLHADQPFLTLYFYRLRLLGEKNQYSHLSTNTKLFSQLEAIERICFAFHFPLSSNVMSCDYDIFLKCFTNEDHQDFIKIEFLGSKMISLRELSFIQCFHKSIFALQPLYLPRDELSSSFTDSQKPNQEKASPNTDFSFFFPVSFPPLNSFMDQDFFIPENDVIRKLVYFDYNEWKSFSNNSYFLILPLPFSSFDHMEKESPQESTTICEPVVNELESNNMELNDKSYNSLKKKVIDLSFINCSYLKECAKEAIVLINNLAIIQENNLVLNSSSSFCFPSHTNPMKFQNMLCTTNGRNLVCFENSQLSFSNEKRLQIPDRKRMLDPISSNRKVRRNADSKTFFDYFIGKSEQLKQFMNELLQKEPEFVLYKGYPLSGKLTLFNTLLTPDTFLAATGSSSSAATSISSEVHLMPELSLPIGNLHYFHMIFLLPSLTHRIQSVLLANEVYHKFFLPAAYHLPKIVISSAEPASSLEKRRKLDSISSDVCERSTICKPSFPVKISQILQALTTKRNLESIDSERLKLFILINCLFLNFLFLPFHLVLYRLELLGDSFLKYASTLLVFFENPTNHEGIMTVQRRKYIGNFHLKEVAVRINVIEYLRASPLARGFEEVMTFPPGQDEDKKNNGELIPELLLPLTEENRPVIEKAVIHDLTSHPSYTWKSSLRNVNLFLPLGTYQQRLLANVPSASMEKKQNGEGQMDVSPEVLNYNSTKRANKDGRQYEVVSVNAKTLADLIEALLGICVLEENNEDKGLALLYQLGVIPTSPPIIYHRLPPSPSVALEGQLFIPTNTSYVDYIKQYAGYGRSGLSTSSASDSYWPFLDKSLSSYSSLLTSSKEQFYFSKETTRKLENLLFYTFQNKELLFLAFSHPTKHDIMNYQRLEFLGDAVIDYLIIRYLYKLSVEHNPAKKDLWSEGIMTKLKNFFTTNEALSQVAYELELYTFIQCESFELTMKINKMHEEKQKQNKKKLEGMITEIQQSDDQSNSDENQDAEEDDLQDDLEESNLSVSLVAKESASLNMFETISFITRQQHQRELESSKTVTSTSSSQYNNKVLADIFEAIVGAIFIDCSYNLLTVKEVLTKIGYLSLSKNQLQDLLDLSNSLASNLPTSPIV